MSFWQKLTSLRTQLCQKQTDVNFAGLEKEMATHSSVLAWRIPGTGEPGGLPSMGSHRVGHPLQCSCLENPMDGEAWWAAVSEVTQSRTQLKRLSSSSSSILHDLSLIHNIGSENGRK